MNDCICPTVEIKCQRADHVSEAQRREIANMLNAQVSTLLLDTPEGRAGAGQIIWGKHRADCPVTANTQTEEDHAK